MHDVMFECLKFHCGALYRRRPQRCLKCGCHWFADVPTPRRIAVETRRIRRTWSAGERWQRERLVTQKGKLKW